MNLSPRYLFLNILLFVSISNIHAQAVYIAHGIAADDHKQKKPLENAISYGFAGVSVELGLKKDGSLKCGSHDLENDYLKSLEELSIKNAGNIYKGNPEEFILVLKIDGDEKEIIDQLEKSLPKYKDILSSKTGNSIVKRPVRLILAKERSKPFDFKTNSIYIFQEVPFDNVPQNDTGAFNGLAGLYYKKIYDWKGNGAMPNMQYHSFSSLVKVAHKAGKKVRIYDFPEVENAYELFISTGADYLEVKNLKAFEAFSRKKKKY